MAWNPYTDQKNRAYQGILTSLFPEQTKTFPRIIVWSLIFLADLILGFFGAISLGLLDFSRYANSSQAKLSSALVIAAIVAVFWLQGKIWYGLANWFHNRNKLD